MSISKRKLLAYQKKLGTNLKVLRKERLLSQLDLAIICDYEKTTISRIENGRSNVTLKTLLTLANALEVDIKDLLDWGKSSVRPGQDLTCINSIR